MTSTAVERRAFVHAAEVDLVDDTDPRAVGAAVTVALFGHWEHAGACRGPHNNAIDTSVAPARFRALFVAPVAQEEEVRRRIDRALSTGSGWKATAAKARAITDDERELSQRLQEYDGGD